MALPLGTDVEYIGQNASGGMSFGQSATELISFYGTSPTAQISGAVQATTAATWATVCATRAAFATSDDATTFFNMVKNIQHVLKTTGLWKGAA